MLRKLAVIAMVGIALVAFSMQAVALPTVHTATLTNGTTTTKQAAATLQWSPRRHWQGSITVNAKALPPGDYVYTVLFDFGTSGGTGDAICSFHVGSAQRATSCQGTSKNLTRDGSMGTTNYAQVFPQIGGYPLLQGTFDTGGVTIQ
jgi:hypothetical protein